MTCSVPDRDVRDSAQFHNEQRRQRQCLDHRPPRPSELTVSEHPDTTSIPQLVTSPTADRNLHGSSDSRSTQWIHYVVKTTQPRGAPIVYSDALMTATTAYGYATRT